MGLGGAGDFPLGRAAVIGAGRLALPLAGLLALGGCKAMPEILGLISGGAAGAAVNPAAGFAVGIATAAAGDALVAWYGRSRQHYTQLAIAEAAGPLPVGGSAAWRIGHLVPIGNEHGNVLVTRPIPNPLAPCKEVLFSVVDGDAPAAPHMDYAAAICQSPGEGWQWASAEPAVARWGYLQ